MRSSLALLAFAALTAVPLAAQVGHDPASSPYRELTQSRSLTVMAGRFTSNGGRFGLSPNSGYAYGLRYGLRANKFLELSLAVSRADLERVIVDQFVPVADRVRGPFTERMTLGEVGFTFNLTGGKTWRGVAPFAGFGLGVARSDGINAENDTTGFRMGSKFIFTPHAGARVFLSDKLHLRAEAKAVFWRLRYPDSFGQEPPAEPGIPPASNAVIQNGLFREWVPNAVLQVGLGYAITIF